MINERLKEIRTCVGMNQKEFSNSIGLEQGSYSGLESGKKGSITKQTALLLKLVHKVNMDYLYFGIGDPLDEKKESPEIFDEKIKGSIPYYADLLVSAGDMGLIASSVDESPTGYMMIPNVSAERLFPVIGCSMLPKIKAGDIVGVNSVNNWDRVEPDKIYMIITREERMIKRLRIDDNDSSILWCVSDNYKEFKIDRDEIVRIFHVVYHGEVI